MRKATQVGFLFEKPLAMFRTSPIDRIELAKQGVPAEAVNRVAKLLHVTQNRLADTLGFPRGIVARKTKCHQSVSVGQAERLIGIVRLIGQVEDMVEGSPNSEDFDAGSWVSQWLETPLPALGNRLPAELMDTVEGQQLVARTLAQSESGAYC